MVYEEKRMLLQEREGKGREERKCRRVSKELQKKKESGWNGM